jgi:ubiquinol-cytochrome c reductase cytochrome c1 subunit
LSVITKARKYGVDYIYNLLLGYVEPPKGMEVGNGMWYNKWMAGNQIAMPAPIADGSVDYDDGTDNNAEQLSADVTHFLHWAAEPEMEERKNLGIKVILFFIILGTIVYLAKNRLWRDVT